MKNYLVWLDPELKEVLAVEQVEATEALITQLKREKIEVAQIEAISLKNATQIWLKNFEELNPHNPQIIRTNLDEASPTLANSEPTVSAALIDTVRLEDAQSAWYTVEKGLEKEVGEKTNFNSIANSKSKAPTLH